VCSTSSSLCRTLSLTLDLASSLSAVLHSLSSFGIRKMWKNNKKNKLSTITKTVLMTNTIQYYSTHNIIHRCRLTFAILLCSGLFVLILVVVTIKCIHSMLLCSALFVLILVVITIKCIRGMLLFSVLFVLIFVIVTI
jgi:hypothetical protein